MRREGGEEGGRVIATTMGVVMRTHKNCYEAYNMYRVYDNKGQLYYSCHMILSVAEVNRSVAQCTRLPAVMPEKVDTGRSG